MASNRRNDHLASMSPHATHGLWPSTTMQLCKPNLDGTSLRTCSSICDPALSTAHCALCACSTCSFCSQMQNPRLSWAHLGLPCHSGLSHRKDGSNVTMCEDWCEMRGHCASCKCKACRMCMPSPPPPPWAAPSPAPLKKNHTAKREAKIASRQAKASGASVAVPAPAKALRISPGIAYVPPDCAALNRTMSCDPAACVPSKGPDCDRCECRTCPHCTVLKHQKKRAGANAAVESEPQHTLANCSWLGEMRNLRVINTFCWFLYNTDRSRCESAVTSAPKTAGGGVCSVGDASRCLWHRCLWMPGGCGVEWGSDGKARARENVEGGCCVGGEPFSCAAAG